jgi:hypothetical protein
LDPVDTSFVEHLNRQAVTDIPDPEGEILRSLLSNMKTVIAKQKHFIF